VRLGGGAAIADGNGRRLNPSRQNTFLKSGCQKKKKKSSTRGYWPTFPDFFPHFIKTGVAEAFITLWLRGFVFCSYRGYRYYGTRNRNVEPLVSFGLGWVKRRS